MINKDLIYCSPLTDPAPGTSTLLDQALAGSPKSFHGAASPTSASTAAGYTIGTRISIGLKQDGAVQPAGSFALPIDPFSGYCVDGGLSIGFGYDSPGPTHVRTSLQRKGHGVN
jgi:hypothetical protein